MIDRDLLMEKLEKMGISNKIINIIGDLYQETDIKIFDGGKISRHFKINKGVRQGCILSPLLFALYMNDMENSVRGGIKIGTGEEESKIKSIMYADDVVILAESSDMIKMMFNDLRSYLTLNKLNINLKQTNVVIFNKPKGRVPQIDKVYYYKKEVERVNNFKYLGVTIKQDLSLELHIKQKAQEAKKAINATWAKVMQNQNIGEDIK